MARATTISKSRILIVEDDRDIASILSLTLEDRYDVVVVSSPQAANREIRSGAAALILLDWHLEGGSGREVLETLAHLPADTRPPVVVTSAGVEDEMLDQAVANGAARLLPKPFQLVDLLNLVARLVSGVSG